MTSTDASPSTSIQMPEAGTVDMKLEVVTLPVSDVDRAKRFYQSLGWRLDADIVVGDAFRAVQLTPPTRAARSHSARASPPTSPGRFSACCWPSTTSTRREPTSLAGASRSARSSTWRAAVFWAPIRKAAPTRRMPRSATRTATDGCSRRSRRGFRAASGRTPPRTSLPWPACSTKRPSITTPTRRAMPRTTGGTGMPRTSTRASRGGRRRRHRRPQVATWTKSCTLRPRYGHGICRAAERAGQRGQRRGLHLPRHRRRRRGTAGPALALPRKPVQLGPGADRRAGDGPAGRHVRQRRSWRLHRHHPGHHRADGPRRHRLPGRDGDQPS